MCPRIFPTSHGAVIPDAASLHNASQDHISACTGMSVCRASQQTSSFGTLRIGSCCTEWGCTRWVTRMHATPTSHVCVTENRSCKCGRACWCHMLHVCIPLRSKSRHWTSAAMSSILLLWVAPMITHWQVCIEHCLAKEQPLACDCTHAQRRCQRTH